MYVLREYRQTGDAVHHPVAKLEIFAKGLQASVTGPLPGLVIISCGLVFVACARGGK